MRKILLFLALTLTTNSFSQEIVVSEKTWSNLEEHCHSWGSIFTTDFLRFDKDTIIDAITYKKVWISEDENQQTWNFYGSFIREENGKVYFREFFGQEGLIYDFNIEPGDSVLIDNPRAVGPVWLKLETIDTILLETGERERWKMTSSQYPDFDYWIRGIGSEAGVINSSTTVFGGLCGLYELLCLKSEGELVYLNQNYNTCYLYTVGEDELPAENSSVYFNRSLNQLVIKFDSSSEKSVYLFNQMGNLEYSMKAQSGETIVPVNNYSPGMHVLTIVDGSVRSNFKFIIAH